MSEVPRPTDEHFDKLHELVRNHPSSFARNDHDLGRTNVLIHHIMTTDASKCISYSSVPEKLQSELDRQVTPMLAQGVIGFGVSPRSSPVLLQAKKSG